MPLVITGAKLRQAAYYNRIATPRRSLQPGEAVRIRCPGSTLWSPGFCVQEVAPRSYDVQVGNTIYRRNRNSIRTSRERALQFDDTVSVVDEPDIDSSEVGDMEDISSEPQVPPPIFAKCPATQTVCI